ncbi:hypothetical protein [Lactobacillus sp. ESL0225]|uniref:hypothetical protein n=1 Tax=Lactobacillus sp. ESL0225 TaxID=2069351 RepID=UPI0013149398|nr:hypothetical protein [Lactobacillus sp. ESL0225]
MLEKLVAENLITIIGNQAIQMAQLRAANESLKTENEQLKKLVADKPKEEGDSK